MLAHNVGHLSLPFPGDGDERPEAIDDQVHAVGLKLHLRERPGATRLLGDVIQGEPNDGERDVVFAPHCRESVCLDQVQERKRTPLVAVQPDQWLEATHLRVVSQRLSEAPRAQGAQRQVEVVRGLDKGIGRRCQDFNPPWVVP